MSDIDDATRATELALAGLREHPGALEPVAAAIGRAIALARFEIPDERDGPCLTVEFGATPQRPKAPMFPAFVALRATVGAPAAALMQALEELQQTLVWRADCSEFTDARHTSIQFLRAAGYLEIAAERLLVYAGRGGGQLRQ